MTLETGRRGGNPQRHDLYSYLPGPYTTAETASMGPAPHKRTASMEGMNSDLAVLTVGPGGFCLATSFTILQIFVPCVKWHPIT